MTVARVKDHADASLIAAAPELLGAPRRFADDPTDHDVYSAVLNLLAKLELEGGAM